MAEAVSRRAAARRSLRSGRSCTKSLATSPSPASSKSGRSISTSPRATGRTALCWSVMLLRRPVPPPAPARARCWSTSSGSATSTSRAGCVAGHGRSQDLRLLRRSDQAGLRHAQRQEGIPAAILFDPHRAALDRTALRQVHCALGLAALLRRLNAMPAPLPAAFETRLRNRRRHGREARRRTNSAPRSRLLLNAEPDHRPVIDTVGVVRRRAGHGESRTSL